MAGQSAPRGSYHSQAKHALDELIQKLTADDVRRLPAEDELSEQLRYSRPTVRSALLSLQKEGKIQRLHGVGSFINRHAVGMQANLGEDRPFMSLIASLGHTPSLRTLSMGEVSIPQPQLDRLELTSNQSAWQIRRVFEASSRPAVHSIDLVPVTALTGPQDDLTPGESTFEFVRLWTNSAVRYSVVDICAEAADAEVSTALGVNPGTPLILLDHLHVDGDDNPVALTRAYLNDEILRFSMVRAYLDI